MQARFRCEWQAGNRIRELFHRSLFVFIGGGIIQAVPKKRNTVALRSATVNIRRQSPVLPVIFPAPRYQERRMPLGGNQFPKGVWTMLEIIAIHLGPHADRVPPHEVRTGGEPGSIQMWTNLERRQR